MFKLAYSFKTTFYHVCVCVHAQVHVSKMRAVQRYDSRPVAAAVA